MTDSQKLVHEFCSKVPKNAAVVLISSGSIIGESFPLQGNDRLDLKDGSYGALRAEDFLHYGFNVIFLHSKGSQIPFMSHSPCTYSEWDMALHVSSHATVGSDVDTDATEKDVVTIQYTTSYQNSKLVADLRARDSYRRTGAILLLEFDGCQGSSGYASVLQSAVESMHGVLGERGRMLLYLLTLDTGAAAATINTRSDEAAAVAEHHAVEETAGGQHIRALQSAPGAFSGYGEASLMEVDDVVLRYLGWLVKLEQFHVHGTINQYRNQVRAGVKACTGRGYQGKGAQFDIAEGDAGDDEKTEPIGTATDSRLSNNSVVGDNLSVTGFPMIFATGMLLGYALARLTRRV